MNITGLDTIKHNIERPGYFVKCIVTESVVVFFPGTTQHRDVKQSGASYEDDYKGNAMAATITPGKIDIRFHARYSDEEVRNLSMVMLRHPEMSWASGFAVSYQGRKLLG